MSWPRQATDTPSMMMLTTTGERVMRLVFGCDADWYSALVIGGEKS